MPKIVYICGPNGAGKSSLSRSIARNDNLLVIDPDKLASEGLSPIAAGKAAIKMARLFIKEKISFIRESTLTAKLDFALIDEAKRHGYNVELIYIKLKTPELAIERVLARQLRGGHGVPAHDVVRRFHRSLLNLKMIVPLVDKVTILDNSNTVFQITQI